MADDTYTPEQILADEGREPDLVLHSPDDIDERQKRRQSIAHTYWLFFRDDVAGGCIVYGKFDRGWVINPSLRWPVAELARRALATP